MAVTIRDLLVRIGVKADTKQLRDFDRGLGKFTSAAGSAVRTSLMLGTALVGAAAVGVASLVALSKSYADTADEAAKAAQRAGITSEEFQELSFAASEAGASLKDVETAFRRQAVSARDAQIGVGTAAKAYKRLGINVSQADGALKPQMALFTETADAISKVESETEKLALANDVFGRGGAKLLPLLNAGAEGMDELRQRARDLGVVIDDDAAAAAESFNDRLFEVQSALGSLKNDLAQAFIPILTRLLEGVRDWFEANRAIIRQRLETWARRIAAALVFLEGVIVSVDDIVRTRLGGWEFILISAAVAAGTLVAVLTGAKFVGVLITVGGLLSTMAAAVSAVALAIGTGLAPALLVIGAILAGLVISFAVPLLSFLAVLGSIALVIDDVLTFLRGGDSVIGRFVSSFLEGNAAWESFLRLMGALRAEFGVFVGNLRLLAAIFLELLTPAWLVFRDAMTAGAGLIGMVILELASALGDLLGIDLRSMVAGFDAMTAAVDALRAAEEGVRDTLLQALEAARQFSATVQGLANQGNLIEMGFGAAGDFLAGSAAGVASTGADLAGGVSSTISNTFSSAPTVNVNTNEPGAMRAEAEALLAEERRNARAAFAGGEL